MAGDEVFGWLSGQPDWQQDLARRLALQVELSNAEYEEALRMVRASFGASPAPGGDPASGPQPVSRGDLESPAPSTPVRLRSFGSLQGVGLVSAGDDITFEPDGLTLVYGQNAAGKSSYVRALKVLCRAVDRDCRIRGSIYEAASAAAPSAKIETSINGDVQARRTELGARAAVMLPGMSVFDAACAELYVNGQNLIQYIPPELRVLARLAAVQDRMRRDLATERQALEASAPSLDVYPETSAVRKALASLRGTSHDADLSALGTLTGDDRERLKELREFVAAAASSTSHDDALAARRDVAEASSLATAIDALAARAGETAAARLRQAAAADVAAREAVRLAAEQMVDLPAGVGSEAWQLLWSAARDYVSTEAGSFPPVEGDPCPLCYQRIDATAASRLTHFEAHVTSTVSAAAGAAAEALKLALSEGAPGHAESCRTPLVNALLERAPDVAQAVVTSVDELAAHLETMSSSPLTATAATVEASQAISLLTAWGEARDARATALLAAEDPAVLDAAKSGLAELEARERLGAALPVFTAWRERLQTLNAINEAHSALATNRITMTQRDLTETQVGKALDAALTEELARLACTHLPVELNTRTAQAETRVGLRLLAHDETKLAEIVSDGERRALALAFFFAELSVIEDAGGIIVDDPVSSLDDERRAYIADRLVAEAAKRQVVVFTHDLAFLLDLQAQAEVCEIPFRTQGLWRLGDVVGRVDEEPPFKTMKLKARLGRLRQIVEQWDSEPRPTNQDEAWGRVQQFYRDLRTSWERAVEERLFKGVVQRFQREVKTLSLKKLVVTPEMVEQIEEGMTRASMFLHDQPPVGGLGSLPTRTDLARDLEVLADFEKQVGG